ncbi:Chromosome partition protein Smc [Halomonadaceae bacterium LMG 33818]|uniref:DNA recombination protein RmuC n=1 Tax=Cernens ardua TaxID=3402176 RepID=UPI003EDB79A6
MQSPQGSPEFMIIAIIAGLVLALLGYLLAMVLQGRKVTEYQGRLRQLEEALADTHAKNQQQQEEVTRLNNALHTRQLSESRLQQHVETAQQTEQRLNATIAEYRQELQSRQQTLENARNAYHQTVTQLETVQADHRATKERVEELLERLTKSEQVVQQERASIHQLNEKLANEGKKAQELWASNKDAREQLLEHKQAFDAKVGQLESLQKRHLALNNEYTELKTTLQRKEEHFKEQMQQLGDSRQSLTKEFENLANRIFEEKGKTFSQASQSSLDHLLKPFREQIEGFQKRVNEVHDASLRGNTNLNAEIRKVLDIGMKMSKEANNLTSALKGDSQQRGAWGEAQLRRTLEMSGLMEDAHYEVQSAFRDAEGKQKQTDYLIKLPDGKHIIIDSKVSLNAYDRVVSAETPEAYNLALNEHVRAVRRHIDDLASKDYTSVVGRSPNFVLMFMSIEPAYIEALKNNRDLFEYGYKKNIVLVSHTTLIPILRTVSNLWMIENSNAEAREISEKAGDIYNSVCTVAERLSKLGGTLNTVSNHYNSTVKALAGQQGLYGKVDRFSQLSSRASKTLPVMEASHVDFETERLSLIVEPIEEPADDASIRSLSELPEEDEPEHHPDKGQDSIS